MERVTSFLTPWCAEGEVPTEVNFLLVCWGWITLPMALR